MGLLHWDTHNKPTLLFSERNKLIETAVQSVIKQADGKQCVLVAPEYFYSRPIANKFEWQEKEVNHEEDFLAYIPENFHEEYRINKPYYPGSIRQIEEGQYQQTIFLPGEYTGNIGKINGFNFGIEICADHGRGFLKKSLMLKKEPVDFHVCQSAYLSEDARYQCQSVGGYFIHASSELKFNKVIKREKEFVCKEEDYYHRETINCGLKGKSTFTFFKLPVSAAIHNESRVPAVERRMSI